MTRQDRSLWVVLVSQWRVSLCVTINLASYEVINVQRRRDRKKHMQMFLDDASDSDVSSTGGADLSEVPLSLLPWWTRLSFSGWPCEKMRSG